jgi:hypothetical protein
LPHTGGGCIIPAANDRGDVKLWKTIVADVAAPWGRIQAPQRKTIVALLSDLILEILKEIRARQKADSSIIAIMQQDIRMLRAAINESTAPIRRISRSLR